AELGAIAVLKEHGIRPTAAHPKVCGAKRRRQHPQAAIVQVEGRTFGERVLVPAAAALPAAARVRLPEGYAGYGGHLDVVGLIARIDVRDALQGVWIDAQSFG